MNRSNCRVANHPSALGHSQSLSRNQKKTGKRRSPMMPNSTQMYSLQLANGLTWDSFTWRDSHAHKKSCWNPVTHDTKSAVLTYMQLPIQLQVQSWPSNTINALFQGFLVLSLFLHPFIDSFISQTLVVNRFQPVLTRTFMTKAGDGGCKSTPSCVPFY